MPLWSYKESTMNEHLLLDMAADLGYEMAVSGAETYRVEDTVRRILLAYGLDPQVAAVPGYLIVSVLTPSGEPVTRMRRMGFHGNDLDAVERLNALSRRLCAQTPPPEEAAKLLGEVTASVPHYSGALRLLGHFLGAAGFGVLFGCGPTDALFAGLCGCIIFFVNGLLNRLDVNPIFSTLASAFFVSFGAYGLGALKLVNNSDTVIIGAMMILVPGLVFTNALRDMIYGDTSSGINKCVQVLLIAGAMALGAAGARNAASLLWGLAESAPAYSYHVAILCAAAFVGCMGFSILFNVHGPGTLLCALGGIGTYLIYDAALSLGCGTAWAFFWGTTLGAAYAEIMARIRRYPTICYLVVSIIPLIPGAGLYHTMRYAVDGAMTQAAAQGLQTAQLAGTMAASIILVSSLTRILTGHPPKQRTHV